ncbi:MAG: helix-turn-helix transcriptional regulator [Pseudomonadota bacterium]|nr:helix-turn-helix transcriptional regulator [Pseudomonadota bacterium]
MTPCGIIPEYVRAARKAARLTYDQAAKRAGMSKSGWWEIENGRTDPRASTLAAMAQALAVPVGAFFYDEGEPALTLAERRVVAALRGVSE